MIPDWRCTRGFRTHDPENMARSTAPQPLPLPQSQPQPQLAAPWQVLQVVHACPARLLAFLPSSPRSTWRFPDRRHHHHHLHPCLSPSSLPTPLATQQAHALHLTTRNVTNTHTLTTSALHFSLPLNLTTAAATHLHFTFAHRTSSSAALLAVRTTPDAPHRT